MNIPPKKPRVSALVIAVLGGLFSLLILVPRAAVSIQDSDGADFALRVLTGGVPHPPGYPLYMELARIAGQIGPDNIYHSLAVFSSLMQSLSVGVLAFVLVLFSSRVLLPVLCTLAWAFHWPSLNSGVDAEVFALHHFLILIFAALALDLHRAGGLKKLLLLGISFGIASSHHQISILFLPLALSTVWSPCLKERNLFDRLAVLVFGFVLGLSPYLLLFAQFAASPEGSFAPVGDFTEFLIFVFRGGYGTFALSGVSAESTQNYFVHFLSVLMQGYLLIAILFIAAVFFAVAKGSVLQRGLAASAFLSLFFASMFVLPGTAFEEGVWVARFYPAVCLSLVLTAVLAGSPFLRNSKLYWLACGILIMELLYFAPKALKIADAGSRQEIEVEAKSVLEELPESAVLVTHSDRFSFGIPYLQKQYKLRPDVLVVPEGQLSNSWFRKILAKKMAVPQENLQNIQQLRDVLLLKQRELRLLEDK